MNSSQDSMYPQEGITGRKQHKKMRFLRSPRKSQSQPPQSHSADSMMVNTKIDAGENSLQRNSSRKGVLQGLRSIFKGRSGSAGSLDGPFSSVKVV